jgi:hypothetical protein
MQGRIQAVSVHLYFKQGFAMKQLVLATAYGLTLAIGSLHAAPSAVHVGKPVPPQISVEPTTIVCQQNGTDTGVSAASETFTDYTGYDSAGAASCRLATKTKLTEIDVTGAYFNGAGPANNITVTIFSDNGGRPGAVLKSETVPNLGSGSDFQIVLSPRIKLKAGKYWISVQPSMTFGTEGQWGWELQSEQWGPVDQWTEDGGLGSHCAPFGNWDTPLNCTGNGVDFMYIARGMILPG